MNGLDDLDSDILTSLRRRRRGVYGQPDVAAPPQDEGYMPSPEMLAASAGGAEVVDNASFPPIPRADGTPTIDPDLFMDLTGKQPRLGMDLSKKPVIDPSIELDLTGKEPMLAMNLGQPEMPSITFNDDVTVRPLPPRPTTISKRTAPGEYWDLSGPEPVLRGEGGEGMSALQAQLAGIKGPADAAGLDVGDEFNAFLQARGGNTLPGAAARVDAEAQKEATADVERAVAGASNTSRATSTDDDEDKPSREDYAKRAMVQHLFNVGPALFGRRTQQVADPDAQYRADLAAWLNRKQQREATAAQQERQRRLDELAMLTEGRKAKELEAETAQKAGKEATEAEREKRRREEADREYELKKRADERAEAEAKRKAAGSAVPRMPKPDFSSDEIRFGNEVLRANFPPEFPKELRLDSAKKAREAVGKWATVRNGLDALETAMKRFSDNPTPANSKLLEGPALAAAAATNAALGQGAMANEEKKAQFDALGINMLDVDQFRNVVRSALGSKQAAQDMIARVRQMKDLARSSVEAQTYGSGYNFGPATAAPTAPGGVGGVIKLRRGQEEAELHDATPKDIEEAKADGWEVVP